MTWLVLCCAIVSEVAGTLALRMASQEGADRRWLLATGGGYVAAFSLLSAALHLGMPLGVAYGVWAACGVALTAVASRLLFAEPLTRVMGVGVVLIAAGVLVIELSVAH
jgi:small multidrug resistance pump